MMMNEQSMLATADPLMLLAGGALVCILAYICARAYRNTNDFGKSVRLYLPLVLMLDVCLCSVMAIPVILVVGLDLCGFVVMSLISNHYFYH